MAITAKMVKELRDATSVGMMDCKKALAETNGNFDAAVKILRERGAAVAAKRADKEANEGSVAAIVTEDGQKASMIEVNCETDFVTRNEGFQAFVEELRIDSLNHESDAMGEAIKDLLAEKVGSIGEKIHLRRNLTWSVEATGSMVSYIHMGGKVGVVVELAYETANTKDNPVFQELAKDLALHVAAAAPAFLVREEVPAETVEAEQEIFRKQLVGKPENIIDNILKGKTDKFFSQICFTEQGFVKEDKISINDLVTEKSKEIGDTVSIKRFARYQLGA